MKLEEGKTYIFRCIKTIELPGGDANLMLSGPDGRKYLLPLEYYSGYNLQTSREIWCKVDKINCSGKVFLEPEHPRYREGESYDFVVRSFSLHFDEKGMPEETVTVTDENGDLINAPVELLTEHPLPGEKAHLRIERISKGKIYFQTKDEKEDTGNLEEGKTYKFRIDRIVDGPEDEEYYAATDVYGAEHLLHVRYYAHYGFTVGTTFMGKVIRYSAGSRKTIEPENPWFKPGDIIEVTVTGCTPLENGEGFTVEVFDANGFSHSIVLGEQPHDNILKCRVVKMRKGKPVLERVYE